MTPNWINRPDHYEMLISLVDDPSDGHDDERLLLLDFLNLAPAVGVRRAMIGPRDALQLVRVIQVRAFFHAPTIGETAPSRLSASR